VRKHIRQIQHLLVTKILPTWDTILQENGFLSLVDQYFSPDTFTNALPSAGEVALNAYGTLVGLPAVQMIRHSIRILERLVREYPLDRLFTAAFMDRRDLDTVSKGVEWEDCVRNVCMVPAKVANAVVANSDGMGSVPTTLENGVYFNNLSVRTEELVSSLSTKRQFSGKLSRLHASLLCLTLSLSLRVPVSSLLPIYKVGQHWALPTHSARCAFATLFLSSDSHTHSNKPK